MLTVEGPVKLKKWKLKSEGSSMALYEWILGKRPKLVIHLYMCKVRIKYA